MVSQWRVAKAAAKLTRDVSQSFFGIAILHVLCTTRFLLQLILTLMVDSLLACHMMVGKVRVLCTIGEVGEIVTLPAVQLLPSLLPTEQTIFNLVYNVAEMKTAYLLPGDMVPMFAGFIDNMQQQAKMAIKVIKRTHNVTMSYTIKLIRLRFIESRSNMFLEIFSVLREKHLHNLLYSVKEVEFLEKVFKLVVLTTS